MSITTCHEKKLWPTHPLIAGIDEAGRGPLAGPVVAAAVVFPEYFEPRNLLLRINDSKKLSAAERRQLVPEIQRTALMYAVAVAMHDEIDRLNIFGATMLAMNRAVESLPQLPSLLLVDGNRFRPSLPLQYQTMVKGDATVFSIAAASILAKNHRDRLMNEVAETYPEYGFDRHFGYPTRQHIEAIQKHGRSPIHRKSFKLRQLGEK